jgi:hypothetical protein
VLIGALVLNACGQSATLDTGHLERAATASILAQRHLQVAVHCPAGVPLRRGFTFWCTAQLEVGSYPLLVTETDSTGTVRYENQAPLATLDIAKVERAIRATILGRTGKSPAVSCPQQVIQRRGTVFTCEATAGGHRYRLRVTQSDGEGRVRYTAVG